MIVSTAIGKKRTSVKKQVYLNFKIGDYKNCFIFLVIPYLSTEIILGNDWNLANGILLNYDSKTISIKKNLVPSNLVLFEGSTSESILTAQRDETTFIYLIELQRFNINTIEEFKINLEKQAEKIENKSVNFERKFSELYIYSMQNRNTIEVLLEAELNQIEDGESFSDDLPSNLCEMSTLNSMEKEQFLQILCEKQKLFSEKPGCAKGYEHEIKLTKANPNIKKTYAVPLALREKVRNKIQEMQNSGIIERSVSPYCNPLRIVSKSNDDVRICLDARQLNSAVEDDHEAPPVIHELLQEFDKCKFFSKIDLKDSFWQVLLKKESRPLTAFLFEGTMYQFIRVPFGLKSAGSALIRALKNALKKASWRLRKAFRLYIDDGVLGTETFEEHLQLLAELFSLLLEFNFTINLKKCEFFQLEISFLGFILSQNGIMPDPSKVANILEFEEPKNQKQLQAWLGVCNYYRRFVMKYHDCMAPFRDLLKKDATWEWTQYHSHAFAELKQKFVETVCLHHILPGKTFKVQADASCHGIGGVIFQIDDEGHERIVSIVSRCLTDVESRYTTTELELLAIVFTIYKLRYYLIGVEFEIICDHQVLTFLNSTTYHNSRLIRWSLLLQQFSFSVVYCRGSENIVADFLSRNPEGRFLEENENVILMATIHQFCQPIYQKIKENSLIIFALNSETITLKSIVKNLAKKQNDDKNIKLILEKIRHKKQIKGEYVVYNEILFHKEKKDENWRIVVPESIKRQLIEKTHEKLGHPGVYKTVAFLRRYYYWRSLKKDVKKLVRACDLCQRVKYLTIAMEGEYQLVAADNPSELVTVDLYGPLPRSRGGVEYIFVVLDSFSKLVRLYTLKKATAKAVVQKILKNYIPECGKMQKILSDNGTQFTASEWRNSLEKEGIKVVFSSIRHPESNPTERVMREIGRMMRTMCKVKHTEWANYVKEIENMLNITSHFSTLLTPHELHFGRPIECEIEKLIKFPEKRTVDHKRYILLARDNIKKAFEGRKKNQKSISKVILKVGDLVLLRVRHLSNALDKVTKKFFHLFEGPYKISKILDKNAFILVEPDDEKVIIGTYNRANLRKYVS